MRGLVLWGLAGPLAFVASLILFVVVLTARGGSPEAIAASLPQHGAVLLMVGLLVPTGLALWLLPLRVLWRGGAARDWVLGACVGAALALAYLWLLAPLMTWAQSRFGDYVPPGAVMATVSGQLWPFFIANVVLAPFYEETVYRGHLLRGFQARFGTAGAVVLSCLAFGALHWMGGVWYMMLTGGVAGGVLCALALRRGGLVAPFAAHLTLNIIEFLWAPAA